MTSTTKTDQVVTIVRRRLVLEECVIPLEQFNKMNENMDNHFWSDLKFEDTQWEDFCDEQTYYQAWEGDVTAYTDDLQWCDYDDGQMCFDKLRLMEGY